MSAEELVSTEEKPSAELFDEANNCANTKVLRCSLCDSKILNPGYGHLVQKPIYLHHSAKKGTEEGQVLQWYWRIKNMVQFENIGFSHTVDNKYKYLTCADCEKPCLGIQWVGQEEIFLTSDPERITYK